METKIGVILRHEDCIHCKAIFGITNLARSTLLRSGKTFFCPYCGGHMHYAETTEARLKRQLACERAAHDQTKAARAYDHRRANSAERSRNALKGVVTRTKNRISKGVCPCCNRQFKDLERHMTGQHPDYTKDSK